MTDDRPLRRTLTISDLPEEQRGHPLMQILVQSEWSIQPKHETAEPFHVSIPKSDADTK